MNITAAIAKMIIVPYFPIHHSNLLITRHSKKQQKHLSGFSNKTIFDGLALFYVNSKELDVFDTKCVKFYTAGFEE